MWIALEHRRTFDHPPEGQRSRWAARYENGGSLRFARSRSFPQAVWTVRTSSRPTVAPRRTATDRWLKGRTVLMTTRTIPAESARGTARARDALLRVLGVLPIRCPCACVRVASMATASISARLIDASRSQPTRRSARRELQRMSVACRDGLAVHVSNGRRLTTTSMRVRSRVHVTLGPRRSAFEVDPQSLRFNAARATFAVRVAVSRSLNENSTESSRP